MSQIGKAHLGYGQTHLEHSCELVPSKETRRWTCEDFFQQNFLGAFGTLEWMKTAGSTFF